ncbi:MAG: ATP-dependent nuclease [Planctomycetota bacterium]
MRITKVSIKNFRSIRSLEFEPAEMCALIGGNNAGKSNILKALHIVLGDRWPGTTSVDDQDIFGHDPNLDIEIAVWFDASQEVRGDIGDPAAVWGMKYRASKYKRAAGRRKKGDTKTDFLCIDNDGNTVKVLKRPNPNARPFPQDARVTAAIREALPSVFIDVDRSASYHLSGSKWSILGRLLQGVSKNFREDADRYKAFREKFEEAREVLRTDAFVELESKVIEHLRTHTGLPDVSVILDEVDPINLYKTFSVLFQDNKTPEPVDAERMGSGIQSAVVISLLQAYRELRKENAVLLFEEPELFLHPHGRRHLFRLLCALADNGTQVLYTTHSQDFVDLTRLDNVSLVSSTPEEGTIVDAPNPPAIGADWKEKLRIAKHFASPRNEVFFADSVVLVEGATEQGAIEILSELSDPAVELDKLNCSILEVGGKPALPLMIEVVKALHKRILVIYDTDTHIEKESDIKRNETLNRSIESAVNGYGETYTFDP